jgi:hypothetical protein
VLTGKEKFLRGSKELEFDLNDLWRFHYSNIYSLHGEIAEFVVARALGITEAQNTAYWTLWDTSYRDARIEVKATAYYHLWNAGGKVSKQRTFSIAAANGSYDPQKSGNTEFCRQNDLYVFCLNNGTTKESSYPLNMDNWEFYVVPTAFLNEHCANNKTISIGRIRSFGFAPIAYSGLKTAIDAVIDNMVR